MKEITTDDQDFPTNAEKLPWPQDISGITARLRREGCRSIGRMKGNDDAFEVVMGTLRVLAKHATAKLTQQKKHTKNLKANAIERRDRSLAMKAGDRRLKLANIKKEMEHLQRQRVALQQSSLTPAPIHEVKNLSAPQPPKAPEAPMPPNVQPKTRTLQTAVAKSAGLGLPKRG